MLGPREVGASRARLRIPRPSPSPRGDKGRVLSQASVPLTLHLISLLADGCGALAQRFPLPSLTTEAVPDFPVDSRGVSWHGMTGCGKKSACHAER